MDENNGTIRELIVQQSSQLSLQGQQIAQLMQQVSTLVSQYTATSAQIETLRSDTMRRWDELPKSYVPRSEHDARDRQYNIEPRLARLEEQMSKLDDKIDDQRTHSDGRVIAIAAAILSIFVNTAINYFLAHPIH